MEAKDFKKAIQCEVESGVKIVRELKECEKSLDSRINHLTVERSIALQHVADRHQEVNYCQILWLIR